MLLKHGLLQFHHWCEAFLYTLTLWTSHVFHHFLLHFLGYLACVTLLHDGICCSELSIDDSNSLSATHQLKPLEASDFSSKSLLLTTFILFLLNDLGLQWRTLILENLFKLVQITLKWNFALRPDLNQLRKFIIVLTYLFLLSFQDPCLRSMIRCACTSTMRTLPPDD